MNPRKAKVDKLLKYKGANASSLAFAIIATMIGAFVIGTVVVRAEDVLAPPTALFPEQGQLPDIGGGGAGNLLDALKGGSLAKWGDFKADTVIGGRLGLGQIRQTRAAQTPRIGYPLDIQIVHDSSEDPTDLTNPLLNKNDTAVLRIASGSKQTEKLYTGIRLDRIGVASSATNDDTFGEKWFIGMDSASDHLIIRANGSDPNIVDIDPDKGAACIGAMYVGVTGTDYDGTVNQGDGRGGYSEANKVCSEKYPNSHVCTVEEIFRTITCKPTSLPANGAGWVNKGPPGYDQTYSNDCNGWTSNSSAVQGGFWSFNSKGGYSLLSPCDGDNKTAFSCCK